MRGKITKLLTLMSCFIMILFVFTGCSNNKTKSGEEFKANLNKSKVMMNSEYIASVELRTNKNSTFEVMNSKNHSVQGIKTTKTGRETIKLYNTGKYKIVVKSDNEKNTKTLKVKVVPYSKTINKATSSVGGTQFYIKKVTYEKVKKTKEPQEDPENNMNTSAYKGLNRYYYRAVISYELVNNNDQDIDTSLTFWTPIDDSGKDYQDDGNAFAYSFDSLSAEGTIRAHTRKTGEITMISNDKFRVDHLRINVEEQNDSNGEVFNNGGIASLDGDTTNNNSQDIASNKEQAQTYDNNDDDDDSYVDVTYDYSDDSDDDYDNNVDTNDDYTDDEE